MVDRKSNIKQVAEKLSWIANQAKNHTLSETEDWFDKVTVNRNMKDLTTLSNSFLKSLILILVIFVITWIFFPIGTTILPPTLSCFSSSSGTFGEPAYWSPQCTIHRGDNGTTSGICSPKKSGRSSDRICISAYCRRFAYFRALYHL